jgi:hypothetical protein
VPESGLVAVKIETPFAKSKSPPHNHKMSHGVILRVSQSVVEKLSFREDGLNIQNQKKIHRLIEHILQSDFYQFLKVPELLDEPYTSRYRMRRIMTKNPLYLGLQTNHNIATEVKQLWKELWALGYAAWDFELYRQPDGTTMIIDFDRFGYKISLPDNQNPTLEEQIHLPITIPPGTFFNHVCFPAGLETRLNL